jgi:succinoglycan biosynthesis transport protein ExoP
VQTPDFIREDSPLAGIQKNIEVAELNLRQCYARVRPTVVAPAAPERRPDGPACQRVKELKRERSDLLGQYTPSHPQVIDLDQRVAKAQPACDEERSRDSGATTAVAAGPRPGMSQSECIEAAKARLAGLHQQKVDIEKQGIKKPALQRQWAELTVEVNALESQLRALRERRAKANEDRLLGANEFQENFSLVDPPRVPELPFKPERNQFLAVGLALTAIIGLLLATGREALRQSFLDPAEFEEQTGLQVLAVLPDISSK